MGPSFSNKLIAIKNNKIYYTVGGGSYLWAKMKTQIDILLFFAEKGTSNYEPPKKFNFLCFLCVFYDIFFELFNFLFFFLIFITFFNCF